MCRCCGCCAAVAYRLAGQYDVGRLRRFREEIVAVFKGSLLLSLLVMATIFFLHDPYESRATVLIFWILSGTLVLIGRRAAWTIIRTLRSRGYNQTYSIIVGAGRGARKMARALQRVNWLGIKNIGFVDEKTNRMSNDLDLLGSFTELPELIQKYGVRHVFVALPLDRTDDARRVFAILSRSMVEVRMVCDVPNLAGLSMTTTNLDGLPLIGLRESPAFRIEYRRQARDGCGVVGHRLGCAVAVAGSARAAGQADQSGTDLLSAGALRAEWPHLPHAEIPQHARRCREPDRGGVGRPSTIAGGHAWGRSCARRVSTNCRSCGMC